MLVSLSLLGLVLLLRAQHQSTAPSLTPLLLTLLYTVSVLLLLGPAFPRWPIAELAAQGCSPAWVWQLSTAKLMLALVFLGFLARPRPLPRPNWPQQFMLIGLGLATTLGLSLLAGFIRWQPAPPELWPAWLLANLLLTVVAEEVLFRGYLQHGLERLWSTHRWGAPAAWLFASLLFGLAHAGGGLSYLLLACWAGLFYGGLWRYGRHLGWPIAGHFAVNALHFLLFSYPQATQGACL